MKTVIRRALCRLLVCLLVCGTLQSALAEDEELSFHTAPPRAALYIMSPSGGKTWEPGGKLSVTAECDRAVEMEACLAFPDGEAIVQRVDGTRLEYAFSQNAADGEYWTTGAVLTVTAFLDDGNAISDTVTVLSPRQQLIQDMFALALKNSKDAYYKHAPAETDWDRGVCKNFVMRLFDTFSGAYRMAEYPDLTLYMPKNKSKADSAPYDYGIEWRNEGPADGAPFEIAAQFKYDASLSLDENKALCREVLHSVQSGDFFQMVGDYYYGNGPHSLLFMTDYDPDTDEMHWTDSNMKGDRVDGARWGYLQYDAVRDAEWFVDAICSTKKRGCTIYRLRGDLFVK